MTVFLVLCVTAGLLLSAYAWDGNSNNVLTSSRNLKQSYYESDDISGLGVFIRNYDVGSTWPWDDVNAYTMLNPSHINGTNSIWGGTVYTRMYVHSGQSGTQPVENSVFGDTTANTSADVSLASYDYAYRMEHEVYYQVIGNKSDENMHDAQRNYYDNTL